jgi:hypothetical protein
MLGFPDLQQLFGNALTCETCPHRLALSIFRGSPLTRFDVLVNKRKKQFMRFIGR